MTYPSKLTVPPGGVLPPWRSPEELAAIAERETRRQVVVKRKDSTRRRWAVLNSFVDEGMASLEASDVAVWLALYRHARSDGVATVARARLVALTGLAPGTVKASLARLSEAGWIVRKQRGGPVGGTAKYRIQRPKKES